MSRVRLANAFPVPFPVPTVGSDDVGTGTDYPVGFSLADFVKMYWRVRRWKITANLTTPEGYTYPPLSGVAYLLAGHSTYQLPATEPPADEHGLIAPPCATGHDDLFPDASGAPRATCGFFFEPLDAPRAVRCGNLWYPSLLFYAFGFGASGATSTDYGDGHFDLTVLGTAVPTGGPHGVGGTVRIEPDRYWPYVGADGTAVYDQGSGDALQDPLAASYP